MYAIIRTGGKQQKVTEGQRLDVERLTAAEGATVTFSPVLLVDGEEVIAGPARLAGAEVEAVVVGEVRGEKVTGFTYKPKTNARKHWGHRQTYTTIEITGIRPPTAARS